MVWYFSGKLLCEYPANCGTHLYDAIFLKKYQNLIYLYFFKALFTPNLFTNNIYNWKISLRTSRAHILITLKHKCLAFCFAQSYLYWTNSNNNKESTRKNLSVSIEWLVIFLFFFCWWSYILRCICCRGIIHESFCDYNLYFCLNKFAQLYCFLILNS